LLMKILILAFLTTIVVMLSCRTTGTKGFLSIDNLPLQEYTININQDTTLVTKNGALLKIPKGSLTNDDGSTVILEIKEAYSIEQMINAGLVTESNGRPLSSGGMIYINAKAGQDVKIMQAIKVATPADYLAENMQLFKGDEGANGNVNWEEPTLLPENNQLTSVEQGQALFQSKCAGCHDLDRTLTGPALAHIVRRFGDIGEGTYRYYEHGFYPYRGDFKLRPDSIKKPGSIPSFKRYDYDHDDPYYTYKCNLVKTFGSVGPIMFNDTSTNDYIDDIYNYIQNESDKRNSPLPWQTSLMDCADSCAIYKEMLADLRNKRSATAPQQQIIKGNGSLVKDRDTLPGVPDIARSPAEDTFSQTTFVDFEEQVSPMNYGDGYYQFTIETFGWYNIDILLEEIEGVKESELFVRITGNYKERVKIYLIIPPIKANAEGGPTSRNPDEYAFYKKDGKLPLPQNVKAYILAVTETEGAIAFALKEFTTAVQQVIEISLNLSTKEEFTKSVEAINLADQVKVTKLTNAKNAGGTPKSDTTKKKIDKDLENIERFKPKNCDCDCGSPRPEMELNSADLEEMIDPNPEK
jgi:hypothetical protein